MADRQLNPYQDASEEIEQVSPEAGDETGATGSDLQDLDRDPRFRAWKSKMDKQIADKEAELARLRPTVIADDPNTLAQTRSSLFQKWQHAQAAATEAEEEDDRDTLVTAAAQAARLADKLFEMDVRIAAARRNLNANDPALRKVLDEAYENGEITGPNDIDYLMLTYRERGQQGKPATANAQDMDEFVADLRKKLELELRAKMGLSVPGVSPGASPSSRAKLQRDMDTAKAAGDMQTYLGLKRQLLNMEE